MKKTFMALVAVAFMFCLTGCGTEVLSCTKTDAQTGMTMDQKVDATFVNNEVTEMSMKIDVDLDKTYAPYADTMRTTMKEQYKVFTDNGGKVEVGGEGKVINIAIDLDVKNMTKKQLKNLNMGDVFGTKSATAKELEKEGYTCK